MTMKLLLTLCLFSSPVFSLSPKSAGNSCDHLQTNPPSAIVDLLVNCRIKSVMGDEKYYNLAGCLLVEDKIIDENNLLNFEAMMNRLPDEILNSSDLTDDYWQIIRDCSEEKGESPAKIAKFIRQCIDSKINYENDDDFVQD
ncbi:uncharacterized protein LOC141529137 [Cotesia typhae]|uniref:uncharacterized protein LOC141529137 n=1 Tax=Cotesia typhae TaxID=2053667 RepID=UPI003D680E3A